MLRPSSRADSIVKIEEEKKKRKKERKKRTLIPRNNDPRPRREEAVDVLERPVCRLRVEQVRDGDEAEADAGPDDPEAPAEVGDAGGRDLHDHVVLLVRYYVSFFYFFFFGFFRDILTRLMSWLNVMKTGCYAPLSSSSPSRERRLLCASPGR